MKRRMRRNRAVRGRGGVWVREGDGFHFCFSHTHTQNTHSLAHPHPIFSPCMLVNMLLNVFIILGMGFLFLPPSSLSLIVVSLDS